MANENKTVEQVCEVLNQYPKAEASDGSGLVVLNNAVIARNIIAAHNREILVERKLADDHIFSLLEKIDARDALIKELADALKKIDDACDGDMCKFFTNNEHCSKCKYVETCQTGIAHNALITNESEIAKAREVVNVPRGTQGKES